MNYEVGNNNNNMDKKKFEGENFGGTEVLDEMPEGPNETEVTKMKQEEQTKSGLKVTEAENAIKAFDKDSNEEKLAKEKAIDQLKTDMFTDLISRVDAKLATTKSAEISERLQKIKTSLSSAKVNNGNPITIVETLRDIHGLSLAESIADELLSEKRLKKGLVDYINGVGFRAKVMAEYAKRFQSDGVSEDDIAKMVSSGVKKGTTLNGAGYAN